MRTKNVAFGMVALATLGCGPTLIGCGGGSSPPPGPAPAVTATAVAPGDSGYDVSPVAEPQQVVAMARLKSIKGTVMAGGGAAGIPDTVLEGVLRGGVEEVMTDVLRGQVDSRAFSELVVLDAPVDAMVTLEAERKNAHVVVSVGLADLEAAKAAAERVAPIVPLGPGGMWRLGGQDRQEPTCAVAASAGATPARLLCGMREADLVTVGPYLARTMSTQAASQHDFMGQIRVRPLDERFGKDMRGLLGQAGMMAEREFGIGQPQFDKAIATGANGLAGEVSALVADLDTLDLHLGLSGSGANAGMRFTFNGQTSWIAGTAGESAGQAGPPPEAFWRVPSDATSVFFGRGTDPKRYTQILKVGQDLIEGALAKAAIGSKADHEALSKLLRAPFQKSTASIQASGSFGAEVPTTGSAQAIFDAFVGNMVGWHLIGFTEGPAELEKWLDDAVAAYNRPAFQQAMKKEMGSDSKFLPRASKVAAPAGLGAGSMAIQITVNGVESPPLQGIKNPDTAKVNVSFWLIMMPDGDTTWLAIGTDPKMLAERLKSVKKGAAGGNTLASRAGLETLKDGKYVSGGFVTMGTFTDSFTGVLGSIGDDEANQLQRVLSGLPNQGKTPILFLSDAAPSPLSVGITVNVPSGAIEDMTAFGTALMRM